MSHAPKIFPDDLPLLAATAPLLHAVPVGTVPARSITSPRTEAPRPIFSSARKRRWPAVLALWMVLLVGLDAWLLLGIPQPVDGDAVGFLPQIIHFKQDGRLINTIYGTALDYAPEGDGRYVWHGLLFPLLTAHLIPRADYASVMLVILAYQAVTLLALGLILVRLPPANAWETAALLASPLVILTWQNGLTGRPEVLAMMWIALGLAAFVRVRDAARPWLAGVVIGLVGATSPVAGALLGLAYAAHLALHTGWRTCLRSSALAAGVALAGFFAVLAASPFTTTEWLHGTLSHAQESVVEYARQSALAAWVFKPDRPLMAVWAALFIGTSLRFAWRAITARRPSWPFGFLILSALFIALAAYTSPDSRNYNIAALAPLFFVTICFAAWQEFRPRSHSLRTKMICFAVALLGALSALPLARQSLLKLHAPHGMSREEAMAIVERLRTPELRIAVSYGLFVLCEDTRGVSALDPTEYVGLDTIASEADVVLIQQINPYKPEPTSYRNYTLDRSYFVSNVPKFLGFPLARSPRGFNFAVYRKAQSNLALASNRGLQSP